MEILPDVPADILSCNLKGNRNDLFHFWKVQFIEV